MKMFSDKTIVYLQHWGAGAVSSAIEGIGIGGVAFFGTAAAHSITPENVPAMSMGHMGAIIFAAAALQFFRFLKENPLVKNMETPPTPTTFYTKTEIPINPPETPKL